MFNSSSIAPVLHIPKVQPSCLLREHETTGLGKAHLKWRHWRGGGELPERVCHGLSCFLYEILALKEVARGKLHQIIPLLQPGQTPPLMLQP